MYQSYVYCQLLFAWYNRYYCMKTFFRWATLVLGIGITWWGITLLSVREQALKPATYTQALNEAGVYTSFAQVLEEKAAGVITVYSKELVTTIAQNRTEAGTATPLQPVLVWALNTIVDQQSGTVAERIFNALQIDTVLSKNAEEIITNSLSWLRGETAEPSWWKHIPSDETVTIARNEGLATLITSSAAASLSIGNRPLCTSQEQVTANRQRIIRGQLSQVDCVSPEFENLTRTVTSTILPQLVPETTKNTIEVFLTRYNLKAFLEDVYSTINQINQIRNQLIGLRTAIERTYTVGWLLLFVGSVLILTGIFLTTTKRLQTAIWTVIALGALLSVMALLYYGIGYKLAMDYLPRVTLVMKDPNISLMAKTALASSIEEAVLIIIRQLLLPSFWIGIGIMFMGAISFIVMAIANPRKSRVAMNKKTVKS